MYSIHYVHTLHCTLETSQGGVKPDDILTSTGLTSTMHSGDCTAVEHYLLHKMCVCVCVHVRMRMYMCV